MCSVAMTLMQRGGGDWGGVCGGAAGVVWGGAPGVVKRNGAGVVGCCGRGVLGEGSSAVKSPWCS